MNKDIFGIRTLSEITVTLILLFMIALLSIYNKSTVAINDDLKEETYTLKKDLADYKSSLVEVENERDRYKSLISENN